MSANIIEIKKVKENEDIIMKVFDDVSFRAICGQCYKHFRKYLRMYFEVQIYTHVVKSVHFRVFYANWPDRLRQV